MNKLFEESLTHSEEVRLAHGTWTPATDIYETKTQLILKAEVPGLQQKDIDINITGNTLTLRGTRQTENEVNQERYHCIERSYGSFTRNFNLPSYIQQKEICASLKDGILTVILPKTED